MFCRLNGTGNSICHPGTATRSLPELPVSAAVVGSSDRNKEIVNNFTEYNGLADTNSDLYATLEEHKVGKSNCENRNKTPSLIIVYEVVVHIFFIAVDSWT